MIYRFFTKETKQDEVIKQLGLNDKRLCLIKQIHSATSYIIADNTLINNLEGDGLVTASPNLVLAVTTADCTPIIFFDEKNRVAAIAHAGWKGALSGIGANVIIQMEQLGAEKDRIIAIIGPAIQKKSYQVSNEFYEKFLIESNENQQFFCKDGNDHFRFDLPGYNRHKLLLAGLLQHKILDLKQDTLSDSKNFASYRRAYLFNEKYNGGQFSAIITGKLH